jgi:aromatic-amino-acid transaminase
MDYAPISGLPAFLEAALEATFRGHRPEAYTKAVATAGGCGAVRHVFYNYAEQGETILVPDWRWVAYNSIAREHLRRVDYYQLFDCDNTFNLASLQEKVRALLKSQNNLVIVLNTPAHNPTGYSLSVLEWKAVLDFLKDTARNRDKKITVLVDIAYLDYAGDPDEVRRFMPLFGGLPKNILITLAFSMSKSFSAYGMRSGALIGVSSDREVADEFFKVNSFSNRGTWSNGTRGAQRLLVEIQSDPQLKAAVDAERLALRQLVEKRSRIFVDEANAVGLPICPYKAGFFITVPAANPEAVVARLRDERVFAVPLNKGVRFAICSVPLAKVPGLAEKTKRAMG